MKKFASLCFIFLSFQLCYAQHKFKTSGLDTTKYSEKNLDVKTFRTFNNIGGSFVHTLVNITNESIIPVAVGTPILMYTFAEINDNAYDQSSAVLLALSEITNEIFTQGLKFTVKRKRPFRTLNNVNLTDTTSVKGTYSFPSGHASGSFNIATLLTLRYPDEPVLITGLYTWATLVSLGRMYWGVHYPSDVFAGMIIGAGSAALIYSLRVPIIKAKNNLFNQSERTESHKTGINTTAFISAVIAADLINYFFINSKNKILKNSSVNFSATSKLNSLNYSLSF